MKEQAPRIKRQQIERLDCTGLNAWELAVTLENYLVRWLSDTMHRKRKNLCDGEEKETVSNFGAGFDHMGQRGDTTKQAGATALHTFPTCEHIEHLADHLDAWEDLKEEFGQQLECSGAFARHVQEDFANFRQQ